MPTQPKDASAATRHANQPSELGFDERDFERAARGLIAQHPGGAIETPFGTVWDVNRYAFIEPGSANPATVHPSLWRQAQLNSVHGLFEVAPGVWQVRGYDISNITFIAGQTGWIVIDPLTAEPCARASLALANAQLGARPVVAVIYTHSHADHFGGVLGVTSHDDVAAGRCRIVAPEHFMRETVGENVIAGFAMTRRAMYQFGPLLAPGPRQHVDCGLGKAIPLWPAGLLAPTEDITATGQELVIDGVRVVFQMTPEAEAPAEMNFFFPDHGWLCTAENCTHTMHNLVPIRGALVRDALKWSKYIGEAIELWGANTELMFASHHWPRWGNDDVMRYLRLQRDLYRWMHDQTMRHANHGLTAVEIAELLELPAEFRAESHTAGYYGHLAHNVKAVYQRYLSWYDGNPANLWRLAPDDAGRRYVELAGGAEALLASAQRAFDEGEYRWVAELLNHLVFAEPDNLAARELQADTFEQLGYQSESATFRNAYLTGAQELRNGRLPSRTASKHGFADAMSVEQLLDAAAVRLRSEDVGGVCALLNLTVTEGDSEPQVWVWGLENRALHAVGGRHDDAADALVTLDKRTLADLVTHTVEFDTAVADGGLSIIGDVNAVRSIIGALDVFLTNFAIVEP